MCHRMFEIVSNYSNIYGDIWSCGHLCDVWLCILVGALSWSRMMPTGKELPRAINMCFRKMLCTFGCAACLTGMNCMISKISYMSFAYISPHMPTVSGAFSWNILHILKDLLLSIYSRQYLCLAVLDMNRGQQRVVFAWKDGCVYVCMSVCMHVCMHACQNCF